MKNKEKLAFLNTHFRNDLKYLAIATKLWRNSQKSTDERAMCLITSLVHARALFEFFTCNKKKYPNQAVAEDFLIKGGRLSSALFKSYWKAINHRVMHLCYDRGHSDPKRKPHLKNAVVTLSAEIFRMADDFANQSKRPFRDRIRIIVDDCKTV